MTQECKTHSEIISSPAIRKMIALDVLYLSKYDSGETALCCYFSIVLVSEGMLWSSYYSGFSKPIKNLRDVWTAYIKEMAGEND